MGGSFPVKEDRKEVVKQIEWGRGPGGAFRKGGTAPLEEVEVRKHEGTW